MGKNNFLYSLSYSGEKTKNFSHEKAVSFLITNFKVTESEAHDFLDSEFSVCQNTPYNDVLKVHKEFFNAGLILKLSKESKPTENKNTATDKKSKQQSSNITTRGCIIK